MPIHRSRSGFAYHTSPRSPEARARAVLERAVRDDEIIALRFEKFWTYAEIARRFGITRQRVMQVVQADVARRGE